MSRKLTKEEREKKFEEKWPEWSLVDFNGYYNPCKVQHKCGNIKDYETYFNVEKRGPTCQLCNTTETKWYYNIGDQVDNLVIINRRMGKLQEYQYRCLKCGFDGSKQCYFKGNSIDEYWTLGRAIKSGNRCVCCRGLVVQPGINDVATTDPELISYFVNAEDSIRYSRGSDVKVEQKCPICNHKADKLISVSNLVNEGRVCLHCGKTVSYPEKMMYFLLKEINIPFEMHKVFDWSQNVYDDVDKLYHNREYDFYIPSINAIIEMHGSQHYKRTFSFNNKITLDDQKRIDIQKKSIAENYCDNYINIDCNDSSKTYIVNSILQSKLSELLEIGNVDWNKISRMALAGIAKLVVEDKENHPFKTTTELASEYNVHYSTVITWLKKAGIYDSLDSKQIAGNNRSYPVYSPELNRAFRSMKVASSEIGVSAKCINSAILGINNQRYAGKHPVTGERLTWKRITIEEYNILRSSE